MISAESGKRDYPTRINSRIIINNITQYRLVKGYCLTGLYHWQAGMDQSHHGSTSVRAPVNGHQ